MAGPNQTLLHQTEQQLKKQFKLKLIGNIKYFLVLEIAKSAKGFHLCQRNYTLQPLKNEDTAFLGAKPLPVPADPNLPLSEDSSNLLENPTRYRRMIRKLMYLTVSPQFVS